MFSLQGHRAIHFIVNIDDIFLGYTAARDARSGTLFVRSIYDVFQKHARTEDINTLMAWVMPGSNALYRIGSF